MGVCCIVFDIVGMLFELCMIFFVTKNYFYNFCSSHYMFSARFKLFPNFLEEFCKKVGDVGFKKNTRFSFHVFFTFYTIFLKFKKMPLHLLYVPLFIVTPSLTGYGKWFLQIVDREF